MLSHPKSMIVILIVGVVLSAVLSGAHGAVRTVPVPREDETLITGKTRLGGYLAPVIRWSAVNRQAAMLVGLEGGLIINRSFVIGAAGYGLATDVRMSPIDNRRIDFGYGGLYLAYVANSPGLVHFALHSLIGGGGLRSRANWYDYWSDSYYDNSFFVFEPGIDVIVNITKHMRIGIGSSYRMVRGLRFDFLDNNDISGPSASLIFKFGKF